MPLNELLVIFGAKYFIFLMIAITAWVIFRLPVTKRRAWLTWAAPSFILMFLVSRVASWLYVNPRPFVEGGFTPLVSHAADNGFPSDHALLAGALAVFVWPHDRRLSIILAILAVLVGASRVYAGVHHVIDIVASFVMVTLIGWITKTVIARSPELRRRTSKQ